MVGAHTMVQDPLPLVPALEKPVPPQRAWASQRSLAWALEMKVNGHASPHPNTGLGTGGVPAGNLVSGDPEGRGQGLEWWQLLGPYPDTLASPRWPAEAEASLDRATSSVCA